MLPDQFYFFERGWLSSNCLLLKNGEETALFDSGYVTHSQQLLQLLQNELDSQPLNSVFNSHLHSDHCGGNALLQSHFPDLNIHVPASQFADVVIWNAEALTFEATGQTCPSFLPQASLEAGQVLTLCGTHWQIFNAPGHDNDALIFFEPELKLLISADALWANGIGVIFPEFLGGVGFENVAKTYDLIESLSPVLVIPGHGSLFTNLAKALSDARKKLDFYAKSPDKHALYAAKVLIKFKLMEYQIIDLISFFQWCMSSQLLLQIHKNFFMNVTLGTWIQSLLFELNSKKAIQIQNQKIVNL